MRYEAAEVAADNAVPRGAFALVKLSMSSQYSSSCHSRWVDIGVGWFAYGFLDMLSNVLQHASQSGYIDKAYGRLDCTDLLDGEPGHGFLGCSSQYPEASFLCDHHIPTSMTSCCMSSVFGAVSISHNRDGAQPRGPSYHVGGLDLGCASDVSLAEEPMVLP